LKDDSFAKVPKTITSDLNIQVSKSF
jgi:hypothetical protein